MNHISNQQVAIYSISNLFPLFEYMHSRIGLSSNEYFDMTPTFGIGLICNEKVKNAIEENKLTGFIFEQLDIEIVFE